MKPKQKWNSWYSLSHSYKMETNATYSCGSSLWLKHEMLEYQVELITYDFIGIIYGILHWTWCPHVSVISSSLRSCWIQQLSQPLRLTEADKTRLHSARSPPPLPGQKIVCHFVHTFSVVKIRMKYLFLRVCVRKWWYKASTCRNRLTIEEIRASSALCSAGSIQCGSHGCNKKANWAS